ncbi:thiosulfate sulfurtransferase GlpE [Thalassotalea sp. G2M2-11]|uniref:thiosulfate sulfurtransferase GlpE n=1 Tax=Thalassotalea sp. G2M2-11 TaxID=2787627 RepID=UPI0019D10BF6|nr:thiosulfate sulfurtransferase GlpE [Thalassotalea sp. G2M2-11]
MTEVVFKHMHINELYAVLAEQSHVVVDIRDPASFQASHIPNAIHLTNDNISDFIREADLDAPLVVCCYHGNSSQQAAQFLASQDFTDVYSLDGGFVDWQLHYPEHIEKGA